MAKRYKAVEVREPGKLWMATSERKTRPVPLEVEACRDCDSDRAALGRIFSEHPVSARAPTRSGRAHRHARCQRHDAENRAVRRCRLFGRRTQSVPARRFHRLHRLEMAIAEAHAPVAADPFFHSRCAPASRQQCEAAANEADRQTINAPTNGSCLRPPPLGGESACRRMVIRVAAG